MQNKEIEIMLEALKSKIISNKGIPVFVNNQAKFENWVQVELCGILADKFKKTITPEQYSRANKCSYDISSEEMLIELKIFTKKSASESKKGIIKDIEKLRKASESKEKAIILVAFPVSYYDKDWQAKLEEIASKDDFIHNYRSLKFKGTNKEGLLYFIKAKRPLHKP